ncbi:MAG: hypothetical protein CMJ46_14285 [Planctomyces sp.]|nr:hypothetical protein [Planctomyces sp.]
MSAIFPINKVTKKKTHGQLKRRGAAALQGHYSRPAGEVEDGEAGTKKPAGGERIEEMGCHC